MFYIIIFIFLNIICLFKILFKFVNECSTMDELENMDCASMDSDEDDDLKLPNVYDNYVFEYKQPSNLPIHNIREEIITTINCNSVVIIQGATGCGKTTQVI